MAAVQFGPDKHILRHLIFHLDKRLVHLLHEHEFLFVAVEGLSADKTAVELQLPVMHGSLNTVQQLLVVLSEQGTLLIDCFDQRVDRCEQGHGFAEAVIIYLRVFGHCHLARFFPLNVIVVLFLVRLPLDLTAHLHMILDLLDVRENLLAVAASIVALVSEVLS